MLRAVVVERVRDCQQYLGDENGKTWQVVDEDGKRDKRVQDKRRPCWHVE